MPGVNNILCRWMMAAMPLNWWWLGVAAMVGCQSPAGEATETGRILVEARPESIPDLPKKLIYYQKEKKLECWAGRQSLPLIADVDLEMLAIPIGIYSLGEQRILLPKRDFTDQEAAKEPLLRRLEDIQRHFLVVDTMACYPLDALLVYPNNPATGGLDPVFGSKPWLAEIYGTLNAHYQNHNAGM